MHPAYAEGYYATLSKFAEISEEDIAAGLAGTRNREISPEEVAELAAQKKEEGYESARRRPPIGAGVGALLGGGLGAHIGHALRKGNPVLGKIPGAALGGAAGLLAGGGAGLLAGYLSRRSKARGEEMWGDELGGIAREGRVPRQLLHEREHGKSLEDLIPYATGIQEQSARPLSPEEMSMLRQGLLREHMASGALRGGVSAAGGNVANRMLSPEGSGSSGSPVADATRIAVGGGVGALSGYREARRRASDLSDLYERGYGHLAGRIYEKP